MSYVAGIEFIIYVYILSKIINLSNSEIYYYAIKCQSHASYLIIYSTVG